MSKRRGLTFIEILLLLALLSIMLVLIFPVIMSMRAKGRKTQCMSNLRQVGMALTLYSNLYDGRIPPWLNRRHDAFGKTTRWDSPELLYQAIRWNIADSAVVYCPNDTIAGKDEDRFGVNHLLFSYYFATRSGEKYGRVTMEGMFIAGKLKVGPSEFVMVRDANMAFVNHLPGKPKRGCEHLGGVNAVYLDGHAKWLR